MDRLTMLVLGLDAVEQVPGEETKEKADEEFLAAFNDNLEEFSNACLK